MFDVIGVGTNSLDFVYVVPEHPHPGTASAKQTVREHRVSPGGQTATALCACAAFGLRTAYVGAFGDDANGTRMRDELTRRGVNTDAAPTQRAASRYAVIVIDEARGDRVVLWSRDAALALGPEQLRPEILAGTRLLHVDDEDEELAIAAARIGRTAKAIVTSDIDRVTERTPALVEAVTIPIFAEHVPAALTGERDMATALRALRRPHHTLVCVTLGDRGAMLLAGDTVLHAPGVRVHAVDTTGAGDVFRGAFIYALLGGQPPDEILRIANTAAALACTRHGAIGGVPTLEELSLALTTKGTKNTKGAKETKRL